MTSAKGTGNLGDRGIGKPARAGYCTRAGIQGWGQNARMPASRVGRWGAGGHAASRGRSDSRIGPGDHAGQVSTEDRREGCGPDGCSMRTYVRWPRRRPSCTPTSTRSTPRSSSATTRGCAGRPVIVGGGRGAGRQLRGQGVRRAHGDGRPRRPGGCARDAVVVAAPDVGLHRGQQGGVRGVRRHHAAGRGALDRRGVPRRRRAAADRRARPTEIAVRLRARGARAGRPADHRRRGPHQVPGQGGQRRGQARRAAGRAARRRAGVPAPAAGRAAVGRRPGHRRPSCTTAASRPSARSPRSARRRWSSMLGRASGRHLHALAHNRDPRPVAGRPPAPLDRLAARARPRAALAGRDRRRRWSAWSTGSPAGCARPAGSGRTVVLRLRFDDFTRATRSHTLPPADRAHADRSWPPPAACWPRPGR